MQAREQYQRTKEAHEMLEGRKRKIEEILLAKAKQNYLEKVGRELEVLNSYDVHVG